MVSRLIVLAAIAAALKTQIVTTPAPADVEVLVRQGLEDQIVDSRSLIAQLVRTPGKIAILGELPKARMTLSPAALPHREGYEFYFITAASAQASADRAGTPVHFILVDLPEISGDVATLWIGTDITLPTQPKTLKLCCCVGRSQFRRIENRWTFTKNLDWLCG